MASRYSISFCVKQVRAKSKLVPPSLISSINFIEENNNIYSTKIIPLNLFDSIYFLRPKILVILKFKICHKKQVTLIYLESIYACKNQLVPNMDNIQGQMWSFYLLVNLSQNFQDDYILERREYSVGFWLYPFLYCDILSPLE